MTMPATDTDTDTDHPSSGSPSRSPANEAIQTVPAAGDDMAAQGLSLGSPATDATSARSRQVGKLAQQVAKKPFLSAFVALAAGALLAAVVRSALQRRRP